MSRDPKVEAYLEARRQWGRRFQELSEQLAILRTRENLRVETAKQEALALGKLLHTLKQLAEARAKGDQKEIDKVAVDRLTAQKEHEVLTRMLFVRTIEVGEARNGVAITQPPERAAWAVAQALWNGLLGFEDELPGPTIGTVIPIQRTAP